MSQSAEKSSNESLVQPSNFGKRLGRYVTIALILLAVLVLVDLFSG